MVFKYRMLIEGNESSIIEIANHLTDTVYTTLYSRHSPLDRRLAQYLVKQLTSAELINDKWQEFLEAIRNRK